MIAAGARWWQVSLSRRCQPPPPAVRPGGAVCWCCGRAGREYKPGWFECAHPEGPVRWYAGTPELPLGFGGAAGAITTQEGNR